MLCAPDQKGHAMMHYHLFCPLAKAAEIVAER